MEALVCDVCGGKLVMQAGGVIICDYCGMQYSTESLRQKVTEIKGTVNVQGIASAENFLQRAKTYHEEKDLEKAVEYYNKYLDLNPQDEEVKAIVYELEHQYLCQICGFLYKGSKLPMECPVCKSSSDKFKRVQKL